MLLAKASAPAVTPKLRSHVNGCKPRSHNVLTSHCPVGSFVEPIAVVFGTPRRRLQRTDLVAKNKCLFKADLSRLTFSDATCDFRHTVSHTEDGLLRKARSSL